MWSYIGINIQSTLSFLSYLLVNGTITQWDASFAVVSLQSSVMEVFKMMIPSVTCADRTVKFVSKCYADSFLRLWKFRIIKTQMLFRYCALVIWVSIIAENSNLSDHLAKRCRQGVYYQNNKKILWILWRVLLLNGVIFFKKFIQIFYGFMQTKESNGTK